MKELDYGKGYKYNPAFEGKVNQTYLPEGLRTRQFLDVGFKAKGYTDEENSKEE